MWKEFRQFAARGNVIDLAVGVIIGVAFGKVVTSLVNDIVMPPIGMIVGRVDFRSLFVTLNGQHYAALADAQKAGAPTINYGNFIKRAPDLRDRGLRDLSAGQGHQPHAPSGPCRSAQHQGLPLLRDRYPAQGFALPELHFGSTGHACPLGLKPQTAVSQTKRRRSS